MTLLEMVSARTDGEAGSLRLLAITPARNEADLLPGLIDMLLALKERGILMGIVSNAQFFTPMS